MSQYHELNFDRIIDEWAADQHEETKNEAVFQYERDYSRIKFIDDDPEFAIKAGRGHPRSEVLYEETFQNNTGRQQMFSLKLTRETVSTGRIDLSNALVMDGKTRLHMKRLPDVPATAGFGSEIGFQDIGSHEMKESLSWTVDTQVKVPDHSTVKATVTVAEKKQESNFTINTRFRGNVHCDVINEQTGEYQSFDGSIVEILREYADDTPGLSFTDRQAKFESSGYCSFRFGVEKQVFLEEVQDESYYYDEDD